MSARNEHAEDKPKRNGVSTREPAQPMGEIELDGLDFDRPTSTVQEYVVDFQGHETKQRSLES